MFHLESERTVDALPPALHEHVPLVQLQAEVAVRLRAVAMGVGRCGFDAEVAREGHAHRAVEDAGSDPFARQLNPTRLLAGDVHRKAVSIALEFRLTRHADDAGEQALQHIGRPEVQRELAPFSILPAGTQHRVATTAACVGESPILDVEHAPDIGEPVLRHIPIAKPGEGNPGMPLTLTRRWRCST